MSEVKIDCRYYYNWKYVAPSSEKSQNRCKRPEEPYNEYKEANCPCEYYRKEYDEIKMQLALSEVKGSLNVWRRDTPENFRKMVTTLTPVCSLIDYHCPSCPIKDKCISRLEKYTRPDVENMFLEVVRELERLNKFFKTGRR